MTKENILARKEYTEGKHAYRLYAYGGLHYIKGNPTPYFSFTAGQWEKTARESWREDTFGCNHELLLKHFPQFADLAALHLSDIDGKPMHADANGWYNLAGCFPDAFDEQYHRGNSLMYFADGYRLPTGDECLQLFADHCRITLAEAASIRDAVYEEAMSSRDNRRKVARGHCETLLGEIEPRWKREADACIKAHGLVVYGDGWKAAA